MRLLGRSAHFVCQTESAHQAPPPKHNEERDRKGRAARQRCKALSQSGSPPLSKQARALTITRRAGTRAGRRAAGRAAGAARGPKSLLQCSRKPGWQGSTASTASTALHANRAGTRAGRRAAKNVAWPSGKQWHGKYGTVVKRRHPGTLSRSLSRNTKPTRESNAQESHIIGYMCRTNTPCLWQKPTPPEYCCNSPSFAPVSYVLT